MRYRLALLLAASLAGPLAAQDWPQWRGPGRDGVAAVPPRSSWPRSLKLAWKTVVGEGHSSPVVAGERAFVFARQGEVEELLSLDLGSGRVVWRQGEPAPYTMNPAAMSHGKGPKSTPAVRDGKVYTLGISGILTCRDAATGRLLWRKEFKGRFRETTPLYGAAQSPLVEGGLVIVHVGGNDDGALTAFDAATGAVKWERKGDGPAYASTAAAEIGGVRQIVAFTQEHLIGVAAATGAPLWTLPFTTEYTQNAVTPVVRGSTVYYSGLGNGVRAAEIVRRGEGFAVEPRWSNGDVSSYMSSPVLDGEVLYGFSHRNKGQVFALDAKSGRTLWTSEGRQGDNASLVVLGDALLVTTTEGELVVARKDAKAFTPLATYTVATSAVWAHLAVVPRGFLVKDEASLALWTLE
jgi:outer membrane protein assembly factor BamB